MLGYRTVCSVMGVHFIHLTAIFVGLSIVRSHPDFVRWPTEFVNMDDSWFLSDNWETTLFFITMAIQYSSVAVTFSFGSKFRQPFWMNRGLLMTWTCFFILLTYLILSPRNEVTSIWHIASEEFNGSCGHDPGANTTVVPCTIESPVWQEYQNNGGSPSNGMPWNLRFEIWCLATFSAVVAAWFEFFLQSNSLLYVSGGRQDMVPQKSSLLQQSEKHTNYSTLRTM